MTLAEFNALDLDRRCDAIWEWGFYISKRKNGKLNTVLYSMNGFFVEMIFNLEDNKIIDVLPYNKIPEFEQAGYLIKIDNPFMRVS